VTGRGGGGAVAPGYAARLGSPNARTASCARWASTGTAIAGSSAIASKRSSVHRMVARGCAARITEELKRRLAG
jgi:hypothetical protein